MADNAFIPLENGLDNRTPSIDHVLLYSTRNNNFEPPSRRGRRSANDERIQLDEIERQQIRESVRNMTLYQFYQTYYFNSSGWHKHDKTPVLRVFPRFKYVENQSNEQYFKYKLKLNVPWENNFEEHLNPDNLLWSQVYQNHMNLMRNRLDLDDIEVDENSFEENDDEDQHDIDLDDGMVYMRVRPNSNDLDAAELGLGEQDINHDWFTSFRNYDINRQVNFIQNLREQNDNHDNNQVEFPQVEFSNHQQAVLNVLQAQLQHLRDGSTTNNFRRFIIVQGKAGSGKSTLIQAIRSRINQEGRGCKIVAPTGASSALIQGNTIHSTFKINIEPTLRSLYRREVVELQEDFLNCNFIIIDEMSLVGCTLLRKIDLRCRTAKGINDRPFGGMFVSFFGDLKQLPPVRDRAFYGVNYNNQYVNDHHRLSCYNLAYQFFRISI